MEQERKLAVSIDDDTINMAWVTEGNRLSAAEKWPIKDFRTLTDALLAYEKKAGIPLLGAACVLSVMGATYGEAIMLSRSNWAISRSGLRSVFGRDAIVINDVAARAWAVVGGAGPKLESLSPVSGGMPDFRKSGRWTFTNVATGVGLAVIDVDQRGEVRVLECEMGHCGFAPATEEDHILCKAIAHGQPLVSWEMALTLSPDDPVWSAPGLPATRGGRVAMIARLIGRYIGDTILAHGAWTGAIVTGKRIAEMVAESGSASFNAGFEAKPKFARLIRATPRWRLAGQELTLAGCAIALERHSVLLQSPATLRPEQRVAF